MDQPIVINVPRLVMIIITLLLAFVVFTRESQVMNQNQGEPFYALNEQSQGRLLSDYETQLYGLLCGPIKTERELVRCQGNADAHIIRGNAVNNADTQLYQTISEQNIEHSDALQQLIGSQ